jgi:hypothetical protein
MPKRQIRKQKLDTAGEAQEMYRKLSDHFGLWAGCDKPCRRARACRGDSYLCFLRTWAQVPYEEKMAFRAALKGESPSDPGAQGPDQTGDEATLSAT